jgi:Mg/Co/Ni transporter MgtE
MAPDYITVRQDWSIQHVVDHVRERRLGFDPAASSARFVATLVDVTGLVIYFSIAFVFLRGTLL